MEKLTKEEWEFLDDLLEDVGDYQSENDNFPWPMFKALRKKLEQGLRP